MSTSAKIYLQVSRDGGKTWSTARGRFLAIDNKPNHRVVWRRSGRFDTTAIFRFYVDEPVQFGVGQLSAQIEGQQ